MDVAILIADELAVKLAGLGGEIYRAYVFRC
jgi:hypothetical protein